MAFKKSDYPWNKITPEEAKQAIKIWDRHAPEGLAIAIGRFFIAWSQLELSVQTFLTKVCVPTTRVDHFLALAGQLDLYEKTRSLVALSHRGAPRKEWEDAMKETTNFILGTLREYRNRMAHDFWLKEDGKISSLQFRPEVDRPSGEVRFSKELERTPEEINEMTMKVVMCTLQLKLLCDNYLEGKQSPS